MASPTPQQLLGCVIGALDDAERRRVEDAVSASPALQGEAAALAEQVGPLLAARRSVDPPRGLAARTCRAVALAAQLAGAVPDRPAAARPAAPAGRALPPVYAPPSGVSRWRWPDWIVTACILACSALLVIPALYRLNLQAHATAGQYGAPARDPQRRLADERSFYARYLERQAQTASPQVLPVTSPHSESLLGPTRYYSAGSCSMFSDNRVLVVPGEFFLRIPDDAPFGDEGPKPVSRTGP